MPDRQLRRELLTMMVLLPGLKLPECHQLWSEYDFFTRNPSPYLRERRVRVRVRERVGGRRGC